MHDLRLIREAPEELDTGLTRRGAEPAAAEILAVDQDRRAAQTDLQCFNVGMRCRDRWAQ